MASYCDTKLFIARQTVKQEPARRSGSLGRGSNRDLWLRRLGCELGENLGELAAGMACGGHRRTLACCRGTGCQAWSESLRWLRSLMARVFRRPHSRKWDFEHGSSPLATEMNAERMLHGAQVSKNPAPESDQPGLRRDRHQQGPALRGVRPGTHRGAGAFVRRAKWRWSRPRSTGSRSTRPWIAPASR